jgi:hypothetical protein
MNSHRYRIGQQVFLSLSPVHPGKSLLCKIVKLLPFEDGFPPQYQVVHGDEGFERRASESDLSV